MPTSASGPVIIQSQLPGGATLLSTIGITRITRFQRDNDQYVCQQLNPEIGSERKPKDMLCSDGMKEESAVVKWHELMCALISWREEALLSLDLVIPSVDRLLHNAP